MTRRGAVVAALSALPILMVAGAVGASAQINLPPLLPPPPPQPGQPPPPKPLLPNPLAPPAPKAPPPAPPAPPRGPAPPQPPLVGSGSPDGAIPANAGPFPAHLARMSRSVRRTPARNTKALMESLRALEAMGIPHDEAVRVGMGRFPVGGLANYSHDWWFPRFGPGWRLHLGTDIFAAEGTPVRSPSDGTVRFSDGGLGGMSTYVIQADGTYFYMAHLAGRPPGLSQGQAVRTGDVVGFVGDTGNAEGGSPHLHFEVHPAQRVITKGKGKRQTTQVVPIKVTPGAVLPAVDPKAYLDKWLDEAEANMPNVLAAYQATHPGVPVAVPGSVPAPALPLALGPVKVGDVPLSPAGSILTERPTVSLPLISLAFLLVVLAGSLTPVMAPRYVIGGPRKQAPPPGRRARWRGGDRSPDSEKADQAQPEDKAPPEDNAEEQEPEEKPEKPWEKAKSQEQAADREPAELAAE